MPRRKPDSQRRIVLQPETRVFSSSPAIVMQPQLDCDLAGFSSADELLAQLSSNAPPPFPFARELALYLLLVVSIWPDDPSRLLTAARIFSGALNFHVSRVRKDRVFTISGRSTRFHRVFTHAKVARFNKEFFEKIGGPQSLLFCQSAEDFYRDLWKRANDLMMVHDVIEYLVKTSTLSRRLCSATFAFQAVAHNIFQRQGGYGVASGPKRERGVNGLATTAETVRARFREAPDTIILSFILTRWYALHFFDPLNPRLFVVLAERSETSRAFTIAISLLRDRLLKGKSVLNTTLDKWARVDGPPLEKPSIVYALSADELERAFEIANSVFKRPITPQEKDVIRAKQKTWWRQIPHS
jgi:hypothetical protein